MVDVLDAYRDVEWGDPAATAQARDLAAGLRDIAEKLAVLDRRRVSGAALAELTLGLERAQRQLDYAKARTADALRFAGYLESHSGLPSVANWMAKETRGKREPVAHVAGLGAALRFMPGTAAAWRQGLIAIDHVAVLRRAASSRRRGKFADDEAKLVGWARRCKSFAIFERKVSLWCDQVDPDASERQGQDDLDARRLDVSQNIGGVSIAAQLDPIAGEAFLTHLDELSRIERDIDAAARKAGIEHSARSAAQLRADALSAMVRRSAAHGMAAGATPSALVVLHMDLGSFEAATARMTHPHSDVPMPEDGVCCTASGQHVRLDDAADVLLFARVQTVVTDPQRMRVDLGREQRFFVGAARRAIELRDGTCTFPGCMLPAMRCDIDHLHEWDDGGPTDQVNGHAVCRYHHRRRHAGWASAARDGDTGLIDWTWHGPPDGRGDDDLPDPAKEPLRPPIDAWDPEPDGDDEPTALNPQGP